MWVRPSGEEVWGKLLPKEWNVFEGPEGQGAGKKVDIRVDCADGGGEVYLEDILVQAGVRVNATLNC